MSNNNLTDARLSALIRVARDSLELYEMELPVIDDLMLALAELQQRRAAMLQGAENAESRCTIKTAPALDSLTKNAESRCGNSPVIQDGWVLVPEEPTHEMLEAGDEPFGTYDVYRRMIAAAPQQEVKP
ncbi:hypothetical protein [Enterobacter hormaechei]